MEDTELAQEIRAIKHEFMTFRNGIVSDTLRKAGMDCYKVIFGLNLPQLGEIARRHSNTKELAEALWSDRGVRESRLLATYLYPHDSIDIDSAMAMMNDVQTREEADILCFRLLRKLPFARDLLTRHADNSPLPQYSKTALARNLE